MVLRIGRLPIFSSYYKDITIWLYRFESSDCIQRGRSGQFNSLVSTDTAQNSNPLKAWSWSSNVTSARTRCQKLWYMWNCLGWVLPWEGGVQHQWCVKVARQSAGRFSSRYGQPPTPTCATALPSTTLSSSYLKGSPIIFCSTARTICSSVEAACCVRMQCQTMGGNLWGKWGLQVA